MNAGARSRGNKTVEKLKGISLRGYSTIRIYYLFLAFTVLPAPTLTLPPAPFLSPVNMPGK